MNNFEPGKRNVTFHFIEDELILELLVKVDGEVAGFIHYHECYHPTKGRSLDIVNIQINYNYRGLMLSRYLYLHLIQAYGDDVVLNGSKEYTVRGLKARQSFEHYAKENGLGHRLQPEKDRPLFFINL